ncbi:MAG: VOC family protein [Nitrolancea sp.]
MAQKIKTFLWFDNQAEEAVNFYVSIFKNSEITNVNRYGPEGPGPAGSVMVMEFTLDGVEYIALNGGPMYQFTEAISLSIDCDSQEEVDYLWEKLSDGGEPGPCGWLKDRFGLSWQVVPSALPRMLSDPDPERANRVMSRMLQMSKIDVAELQKAYDAAG